MDRLMEMKKLLQENDLLFIKTNNPGYLHGEGVASFTNDGRIKVFEGAPDGSDDREYTYEEFINKYEFELKEEGAE